MDLSPLSNLLQKPGRYPTLPATVNKIGAVVLCVILLKTKDLGKGNNNNNVGIML